MRSLLVTDEIGPASMIPRVSYILILGVIAFALLAAAGAAGLLDRLPPQPYFPAALAERRQSECDAVGAAWPEQITDRRTSEAILDDFYAGWFGDNLRSAQELSLSDASTRKDGVTLSLRLTWLRSFHAPVIVRVDEFANGEVMLTAKRLSGHGGYGPGGVADQLSRTLTKAEVAKLRGTLLQNDVFAIIPLGCGGGMDGAQWLIEARSANRYHLARRWTPSGGPVHEIGTLLLGFTGWNLGRVY